MKPSSNPLQGTEDWAAVESTDLAIIYAWNETFEIGTIIHYGGAVIFHKNAAGAWYVPPFYPRKKAADD